MLSSIVYRHNIQSLHLLYQCQTVLLQILFTQQQSQQIVARALHLYILVYHRAQYTGQVQQLLVFIQ
jgi:hypothetical protein